MKKVLLAMLIVAGAAMPALASVQNVKVSGDMGNYYIVRNQFDLGATSGTNGSNKFRQNFLLTQTRLRVEADLTDNVQATVGLLNERAWGQDQFSGSLTGSPTPTAVSTSASHSNEVDLNLAYVTLKEMLYSPLTVVVGRQNFAFGNSFVIDSAGTNNNIGTGGVKGVAEDFSLRTAQDAVRLILDYNPLTINIIGSKVVSSGLSGVGAHKEDTNLLGTNVGYQVGDKWQTLVEAYYWAKLDQNGLDARGPGAKTDTVYMPGVHVSTNPIKGLNVSGELAWQRGNDLHVSPNVLANIKRDAMAAQLIANYVPQCPKIEKYKPTTMLAYTYVSGEKNSAEDGIDNATRMTGWDPMFENQSGGKIYNTLFDLSNAHIITTKATAQPIKDVTASLEMDWLWLDKAFQDSSSFPIMRLPNGTAQFNQAVTSNQYIGSELGIGASYAYTEDVNIGAKLDWFTPGDLFSSANKNTASQILVNANVNF